MRKKIALFVPDGVGIRNYLFSSVVDYILKEADLVLITSISSNAIKEVEAVHNSSITVKAVPKYRESVLSKFLRELENISRLRYYTRKLKNDTLIPDHEWKKLTKYKGKNYLFYFLIRAISIICTNYRVILLINRLYLKSVSKSKFIKNYDKLLEELKPDAVLCTHQRSVFASPLFVASKKVGVDTMTVIYSWDNIPKARMAFRADKYLVWSQHMKEEMLFFYPEIASESVIITGTPQFEFYHRQDLILSREDFCREHGLEFNSPIICYSGGDRLTSPFDQDYLNDLAMAVKKLPRKEQAQILFRRCPVDWSNRFDNVIEKHKDIIKVVDPLWVSERDENNDFLSYPQFSDVKLLVNIACHCDLVYNVGSTMAHDYSMFDKPACYISYNPDSSNGNYSVKNIYKFQHFRSMPSNDAVIWVNSKEEIASLVTRAIKNPELVAVDRKVWLEKIILHPVTEASGNIVSVLLKK